MIRIAICDDEHQERERAHRLLSMYMQEHPRYEITLTCFSAALELLTDVENNGGYDLYLLDVYMTGILGIDAARQLRSLGDRGEIIFLTRSRQHAVDAFEVEATQYLIKPYPDKVFFMTMDKVFERLNVERRHIITLKTAEGIVRIFSRNIVFAQTGRNNYQTIHTTSGETIEVRITSTELYDLLLPTTLFVRCGVSIIVNLKQIRTINKNTIIFDSGAQLNYPYRAYQKLKEAFLSFQMFTD